MPKQTGIRARHSRTCPNRDAADCGCAKSWEATVWDRRKRVKIRKTFRRRSEALSWLTDTRKLVQDGKLSAGAGRQTVEQAGRKLIAGMKDGSIRNRSRDRYKPGVIRNYERDLEKRVFPELGRIRLSELRRRDVQRLVDELVAAGLSGSAVLNTVMPLRVICRRAIRDDDLHVNPLANLDLPEGAGVRERVASPAEAAMLIDALPEEDQALWATAAYAGLRRGELRGLQDDDVDLDANMIHVRRGWDDKDGAIEPKTRKSTRDVPIPSVLRRYLLEHRARTGRRGADLFFGRTAKLPFAPKAVSDRARRVWLSRFVCGCAVDADAEPVLDDAGDRICPQHRVPRLQPIGLHELRHTYVSLMHAAGTSLETIGDLVGHTSTFMTDRYRHLIEGQQQEAAARFDAFLQERTGAHSGAQGDVVELKTGRVQAEAAER